jgi:hypothetical protein
MITARDDGWARTHEDVEQLLRYAVPGAKVLFEPVAKPGSTERNAGARRYRVSVPRIGRDPIETADIYTLPVRVEPMARRVRELADYALTA